MPNDDLRNRDRSLFRYSAFQNLSQHWQARANLNWISDTRYYEDFSNSLDGLSQYTLAERNRRLRARARLGRGHQRGPLAVGRLHPDRIDPALQPHATRLCELGTQDRRRLRGRRGSRSRALPASQFLRRLAPGPEALDQLAARRRQLVPAPDRRLQRYTVVSALDDRPARHPLGGDRHLATARRPADPSAWMPAPISIATPRSRARTTCRPSNRACST